MPQMAPMNWLTLMFLFIMIFYIFNSLNYFTLTYKPKNWKTQMKKINFSWKW
nr:ATP synthase F0 subunit 8 [Osphya sp. n.]